MNFIFLGPPGAGKGTLAKEVSLKCGIPHISTVDIFRAAIKAGTPLGKQVKSILDSGGLVSDELTIGLVRERLAEKDALTGFILDGFPRTIPQAEALSTIRAVDAAVNFEVGDEQVVKRLSGRRVCRSCGYSPHVVYMPPKKEGICDKCGGELYTRDDDRLEAITHRLEVYRSQTAPLIEYYRRKGLLVDIDGSPASTVVLAAFFAKFPG